MNAAQRESPVAFGLASVGLMLMVVWNILFVSLNVQYAHLAESFLRGRLDIDAAAVAESGFVDMALHDGRYYWPSGPLPAALLMPVVAAFGRSFGIQAVAQAVLGLVFFAAARALARRSGFGRADSVWLALACTFGSVAIGVLMVNSPWQVAGSLAAVLLLAACVEAAGKDRPWLIGTMVGLSGLSRFTAFLGIAFFLVREWRSGRPRRQALRRAAMLLAPVALAAALLGGYNLARFGSFSDTGLSSHALDAGAVADRRADGGFRADNVARNVWYYFFRLPELRAGMPVVDPHGVSVLLLSPAFFFLLRADRRSPTFLGALAATVPALAVYLTYFTTGYLQFGPRYLLDLLPFWFVVLLETFRRTGFRTAHKAVIAGSVVVNMGLFIAFTAFVFIVDVPFNPLECTKNIPGLCSS